MSLSRAHLRAVPAMAAKSVWPFVFLAAAVAHASSPVAPGQLSLSGTIFSLGTPASEASWAASRSSATGGTAGTAMVTSGNSQAASGSGIHANFTAGSDNDDDGWDSIAMGYSNAAYGQCSIAMGYGNTTNNCGAVALGGWEGQPVVANGFNSTASGGGVTAGGDHSVALGGFDSANGDYSVALGDSAVTNGQRTIALGRLADAEGFCATAIGPQAVANADYSTAIGFLTQANGFGSLAVGICNIAANDDLFVVGNGSSSLNPWGNPIYDQNGNQLPDVASDAFVVKQNGNTIVSGTLSISGSNPVLIQPAGDLSMGSFTTGSQPQ